MVEEGSGKSYVPHLVYSFGFPPSPRFHTPPSPHSPSPSLRWDEMTSHRGTVVVAQVAVVVSV